MPKSTPLTISTPTYSAPNNFVGETTISGIAMPVLKNTAIIPIVKEEIKTKSRSIDQLSKEDLKNIKTFSVKDSVFEFRKNKFKIDPLVKRAARDENLLPILPWEQGLLWNLFEDEICKVKENHNPGTPKCLDVGSGSGFFSTLACRLGFRVTAIDKDAQAINRTQQNLEENTWGFPSQYEVRKQHYGAYSYNANEADLIFLNPPCHIYPEFHEYRVPLYARSGWDGIEEFIDQVETAWNHLKDDGIILFVMMSGGRRSTLHHNDSDSIPGIIDRISSLFNHSFQKDSFHLTFTEFAPNISSKKFLKFIFEADYDPEIFAKIQKIKEDKSITCLQDETYPVELNPLSLNTPDFQGVFPKFIEDYCMVYPRLQLIGGMIQKSPEKQITKLKLEGMESLRKLAWGHRILAHRNVVMY